MRKQKNYHFATEYAFLLSATNSSIRNAHKTCWWGLCLMHTNLETMCDIFDSTKMELDVLSCEIWSCRDLSNLELPYKINYAFVYNFPLLNWLQRILRWYGRYKVLKDVWKIFKELSRVLLKFREWLKVISERRI